MNDGENDQVIIKPPPDSLSAYCVPGTVGSPWHARLCLILPATCEVDYCYHPHFADEETEAAVVKATQLSHTSRKQQDWDPGPVCLASTWLFLLETGHPPSPCL